MFISYYWQCLHSWNECFGFVNWQNLLTFICELFWKGLWNKRFENFNLGYSLLENRSSPFLRLYFALKIAYLLICISWQDFQCRALLQELNAVPSILELLKSEYPVIQLLALKTLDVIANDKGSWAMLRDSQGMDHLIKILETKVFITFIQLSIRKCISLKYCYKMWIVEYFLKWNFITFKHGTKYSGLICLLIHSLSAWLNQTNDKGHYKIIF